MISQLTTPDTRNEGTARDNLTPEGTACTYNPNESGLK